MKSTTAMAVQTHAVCFILHPVRKNIAQMKKGLHTETLVVRDKTERGMESINVKF